MLIFYVIVTGERRDEEGERGREREVKYERGGGRHKSKGDEKVKRLEGTHVSGGKARHVFLHTTST